MLLIATLTLHLGDWPFVDELLEDAQAKNVPLTEGASPEDEERDQLDNPAHGKLGRGYQSLTAFSNIVPAPAALPVFAVQAPVGRFQPIHALRAEFIVGAPFRPPAI